MNGYDGTKIADAVKSAAQSLSDAVSAYKKNADTARAVVLLNAVESTTDIETRRALRDKAYQILLP